MIHGERVRLRAVEASDLQAYVDWLNDPEVRRGVHRFLPISLRQEQDWFEEILSKPPREQPLAVDAPEADDWRLVGSCGLFNFDDLARHAELGIMIGDRSRWGTGLGTDAMRTLLHHGFETLNLRRIYLRVYAFNDRAIGLYEKLGFEHEGRLRQHAFADGQYWDTLVLGLMRSDWRSDQGSKT